jgi:uncharacterized protein YecT (DUF1311 family)
MKPSKGCPQIFLAAFFIGSLLMTRSGWTAIGAEGENVAKSSTSIRDFDLGSFLNDRYRNECDGRPINIVSETYDDFGHDGTEEAMVVACSCMGGTGGPDIHSIYHLDSSGKPEELTIDRPKEFKGEKLGGNLVGNRNSTFFVKDGFLVEDFYDGSGIEHPLLITYLLEGKTFRVAKVEKAKLYKTTFDCSKELSEIEIMICENPDLADSDLEIDRLYKARLQNLPTSEQLQFIAEQAAWRKDRLKACVPYKGDRGVTCLRELQEKRTKELSE